MPSFLQLVFHWSLHASTWYPFVFHASSMLHQWYSIGTFTVIIPSISIPWVSSCCINTKHIPLVSSCCINTKHINYSMLCHWIQVQWNVIDSLHSYECCNNVIPLAIDDPIPINIDFNFSIGSFATVNDSMLNKCYSNGSLYISLILPLEVRCFKLPSYVLADLNVC